MYNTIVPNIFHGQCEPTQFSTEETEVSFSSIHNKLAITNIQSQKLNYPTPSSAVTREKQSGGALAKSEGALK